MKHIIIGLFTFLSNLIISQNFGKVIIYTNLNQPFMASLNGVRSVNQYALKNEFNYLDENEYRTKIWFQGMQYPINFSLQSAPGYESVFQIGKDQYGAYTLNLISKGLMTVNPIVPSTVAATPSVVPTSTEPIIKEMSMADFKERLQAIKSVSFDDAKLEKAKFVFDKEYFSAEQVATVVKEFSFETKKVDFGKFAYKRTIDKNNYYKVLDSFTFDSYKKELQDWIKKNP